MKWWFDQLRTWLPTRWRRRFEPNANALWLRMNDKEMLAVWRQHHTQRDLGRFPLTASGVKAWQEVVAADPTVGQAEAVLVLLETQCLHRRIALPSQAMANPAQVLGFEMNQFTPFETNQVCFDVKRVDQINAAGTTAEGTTEGTVEFAVTPRQTLDRWLAALSDFGIEPSTVTYSQALNAPLDGDGLNMLPSDKRPRQPLQMKLIFAVLMTLSFGLLLANLWYPAWYEQQRINQLNARIDGMQADVHAVSDLRVEIDALTERLAAMDRLQRETIPTLKVLNELAVRLPQHTWLNQLRLDPTSMEIHGFSSRATDLIGLIDDSEWFSNTRFMSPLAQGQSAKQTFKIGIGLSAPDS